VLGKSVEIEISYWISDVSIDRDILVIIEAVVVPSDSGSDTVGSCLLALES
jgi:hypothetical protein